jgi:8-oxo-dGTP pyrophosphatase MutT (NUDIX family)
VRQRPRRGGNQVIPRPPHTLPGRPAPWQPLPFTERALDLDRLGDQLSELGEPVVIDGPVPVADPRQSAVLVAFFEDGGEAHVLLTRRAAHLRNHRGEVSFPGGRQEPGDPDLAHTALREAEEEVGLDPAGVEVLGELDRLSTYSSRSMIHPFVARLAGPPVGLRPDPGEVEQILLLPVSALFDEAAYREEIWRFADGRDRTLVFFEVPGDTIWGATARMLRQVLLIGLGLDPRG